MCGKENSMCESKFGMKIKSEKGFYIGDICYVLGEKMYYDFWGGEHHFADGAFEVPDSGLSFAVASTAYGDGLYNDDYSYDHYPVDAGVIGLVPLELVEKADGLKFGSVVQTPGTAEFRAENGVFDISLPNGRRIRIDTEE